MFYCSKHYPHSLGLSACFRQWRATSHCNQLHGYALAFTFEFRAETLDHRNWVMDFGGMKPVKEWLCETFDHRMIVANDDPFLDHLREIGRLGLANINVMPSTGCEIFAQEAFGFCKRYLDLSGVAPRVRLERVICSEHEGNSAGFSDQWHP